jgi:hypothetical protein
MRKGKQEKSGAGQTFWWPVSVGCLGLFCTLFLSAFLLPLQSHAQAPINLVNLYDWNVIGNTFDPGADVQVTSSTSAVFFGDFSTNGIPTANLALSYDLNTTPGATYEISFTMEDEVLYDSYARETFGNTGNCFLLPVTQTNIFPGYFDTPVTIDYTAVATTAITTVSFGATADGDYGETQLWDVSVIEVPEVGSGKLFAFLGCILLYLGKWFRPSSAGIPGF